MKLVYFKLKEFKCSCCGESEMDMGFLHKLDLARGVAKTPFNITSGYRCKVHNANVGGKDTSSHPKGKAVDILIKNDNCRYKILTALLSVGFSRFGFGSDFLHVDDDIDKSQEVMWTYN